ncbi:hypothetical protein [Iningainema tapete]|uniref:Uncharacterized protein n=1 Tax=Iningainema tapete BLCC-T55 TaxID=2748662 RepID=A0A8J6XLK6_9CYAN|nr:hypothetical protein [Iningainema tapete]MBD2778584.1 hypothetical protein [Iningainema tapete BLCC-T55]
MDKLESKILEILKQGTPIRAIQIAALLGVEIREVNRYLYSSLKHLVVQDTEYKWSLRSRQSFTPNTQSPQFVKQSTEYRLNKKDIPQNYSFQPSTNQNKLLKPLKQNDPYEVVKREFARVPSKEKIQIIESAFRQDKFAELEDEQINALQSVLEQAKREVSIANTAYLQGKLSSRKTYLVAIAAASITLIGTLFVLDQVKPNSTSQPTPTIPLSN